MPNMSQLTSTRESPRRPLGFHRYVTDAISDWECLFKSRMDEYEQLCNREDLEPPPCPGLDQVRSELLRDLIEEFMVAFCDWCPEEVLVFTLIAYPRLNLVNLTREGVTSRFFAVLHKNWKPSFLQWAYFLWEFTGRASELFGDVLYLMPAMQKPDNATVGAVLFKEMIEKELVHPRACASFIGVFIPYPQECTYARKHEETIESLSKMLGPTEIGLMSRSLVLYRSRKRNNCECGYARGEFECACARKRGLGDPDKPATDPLANDLDKEYALVLMKLILDRNGVQILEDELRWTKDHRDEFIRSACEEVFSEAIYTEIYQNLHGGKKPVLKQRCPRPITDIERKNNVTRSFDNDYSHVMAQHGGCVARGCKQAMKTDCANVSCKQHCRSTGLLSCKAHRMYSVNPVPSEPHRKNIKTRDEREWSGSRYVEMREGDI